jgi:hypothetical protein
VGDERGETVDSTLRPDATLPEALAHRARHASDGRLALDAGLGFLAAIGALVWRPAAWFLVASAALCFAAFGVWGIADRELSERGPAAPAAVAWSLRAARVAATALGVLAAAALLLSALAVALGTWIS